MKLFLLIFFLYMNTLYAVTPENQDQLQFYRKEFAPLSPSAVARIIFELQPHDLPKQIDRVTRWDSIRYSGNTVYMNFTFMEQEFSKVYNVKAFAAQEPNFKSNITTNMKYLHVTDNCSDPMIYASLEKGLKYIFRYRLQNGSEYYQFNISIQDCQQY